MAESLDGGHSGRFLDVQQSSTLILWQRAWTWTAATTVAASTFSSSKREKRTKQKHPREAIRKVRHIESVFLQSTLVVQPLKYAVQLIIFSADKHMYYIYYCISLHVWYVQPLECLQHVFLSYAQCLPLVFIVTRNVFGQFLS